MARKREGKPIYLIVVQKEYRGCQIIEEIIGQFDVRREQINAVLEFAARSLDAPAPVLAG